MKDQIIYFGANFQPFISTISALKPLMCGTPYSGGGGGARLLPPPPPPKNKRTSLRIYMCEGEREKVFGKRKRDRHDIELLVYARKSKIYRP